MDKNKYEELYDQIVKNSVGQDKVCEYKPKKKNVKVKVTLAILLMTFCGSALAGCGPVINKEQYQSQTQYEQYYGYSKIEISNFKINRAGKFLENAGYNDYTVGEFNLAMGREYNYTVEDYKKIEGLDESYLYGFYELTTRNTFFKILEALGYDNLNEYLVKNGFVDKNGNPDINKWKEYDDKQMSELMHNQYGKGGKSR